MVNHLTELPKQVTDQPTAKLVFFGLLLLLLVIAVGHLFVIDDLTDLYFGLPLWVWLQLVVVFIMIGIAWITIQLVAATTGGT